MSVRRIGALDRRFPSPLRYPGGKGKLANFLKLIMVENDLVGYEYAEPYAGGAAAGLSLLYEGYVSHLHINDFDPGVAAFWHTAVTEAEWLCRRIVETPITMEEWDRQRLIPGSSDPDRRDLAFATFFLNRTNRSGILRGGVIGGRSQQGKYTMDARYNKQELVVRIERVGENSDRISVTGQDALEFLATRKQQQHNRSLVYLDPPYYTKGGDLYTNAYSSGDHVTVSRWIRADKGHWIVSYDAVDPILNLYSDAPFVRYGVSYSAGRRSRGAEVMFFSESLRVPSVELPDKVPFAKADGALRAYSARQLQVQSPSPVPGLFT